MAPGAATPWFFFTWATEIDCTGRGRRPPGVNSSAYDLFLLLSFYCFVNLLLGGKGLNVALGVAILTWHFPVPVVNSWNAKSV
jgi:hypothetical protein